ncbi:MAG: TIGR03790 family protein [Planctomycetes bacterium]|nr:TIGR03790 family protein [Planctomycetota bacterium]
MAVVNAVALSAAAAPLRPDELLLVYSRDDPRSRELAEYYAKVRGVPSGRLCVVRANPQQEEIPREQFDRYVRTPIRQFLEQHDSGRTVRCLVLFYGLPLRVGPKAARPAEQRLARQWQERLEAGMSEFSQLVARLESPASRPATKPQTASPGDADETPLHRLVERYERARGAAWERLALHRNTPQGQQGYRELVTNVQAAEGYVGLLARTQPSQVTPEAAAQLEKLIVQVRTAEERIGELRDRGLTDPGREEAARLIQQNHGLIGYLQSLSYDIALVRTDATTASLEGELALVWWDDYILYRWIFNPLSWRVRANAAALGMLTPRQRQTPVLMTSRIDGPSPAVARRIIDESIAVERQGLAGKVYVDARGVSGKDGFGLYDGELRSLAMMLRLHTGLDVTLDNRSEVFAQGQCPDAMLYCGWYSLRQYVPAFTFVPGAVGYHIASFEAISIKAPNESGWVKGLLNAGVDATVGPVAEPYLHAFPRPSEFFGLLLTGRFTLAECYAYTSELNSWMMLLIGDPLYRPFAADPQLPLERVFPTDLIPPEFRQPVSSQPTDSQPHDPRANDSRQPAPRQSAPRQSEPRP